MKFPKSNPAESGTRFWILRAVFQFNRDPNTTNHIRMTRRIRRKLFRLATTALVLTFLVLGIGSPFVDSDAIRELGSLLAPVARAQTTFLGPNTVPGVGAGFVGYDSSRNISIGTQYTNPFTKLFILASSSDFGGFAMRVEQPGSGPLFIIRNDGTVAVGLPLNTGVSYGNKFQVNGSSSFAGNLTVSSGTISGSLTGTLSAGNISSGAFAANTGGGNFSFPGKLSVGTSTASTVADSLYVTGSVGVGTASPATKIQVLGDARFGANSTIDLLEDSARGKISLWQSSARTNELRIMNLNGSGMIGMASNQNFGIYTNNLERITIKNDGKVGIGTTAPSSTLDVNGSINASTTGGLCIGYDCKTSWSQVAGIWTTTSTGAFYNGGNVGIGTTSPGEKLDISGGKLIVRKDTNTGTSWSDIQFLAYGLTDPTKRFGIGVDTTGNFGYLQAWRDNDTTYSLALNPKGGNVGIGTSTPSSKLHVMGNGYFDTTSSRLAILPWTNANYIESGNSAWNGNVPLYITGYAGIQGSVATIDFATTNLTGNVGIGTASPSSTLHVVGGGTFTNPVIVGTPTANGHATTKSYVDSVITGGSSSGSFTNISVSGTSTLAVTSGNVGIGTASPVNLLHAYGGNAGTDPSWLASTDRWVFENSGDAYMHIFTSNANTAGYFFADTDARARAGMYYTHSNDKLYLRAGSTDSVTITASNVGIGNTSPSSTLHVSGTGQFTNTVLVGTPTASGHATTKSYVDSVVTSAASQWTSTSTGVFYNGGNVGIGTTVPVNRLHIYEPTAATPVRLSVNNAVTGSTATDGLTLAVDEVGDAFVIQREAANLKLYTNNTATNGILINSSGNVGIGTAAPTYRLVVGAGASSEYLQIYTNNAGTGGLFFSDTGNTDNQGGITYDHSLDKMYLRTGLLPRVAIDNTGSVGIGNTSPSSTLHVTGGIHATTASQFDSTVTVGTPTAASHATTKSYVDSAVTTGITGSINYLPKFATANSLGNSVISQQTTGGTGVVVGSYLSMGYSGSNYGSIGYGIAYTATSSYWTYKNTDTASKLDFASGGFQFNTAPAGTAGNPITFTRAMTILQDGNVGIGNTSPSSTLHVSGTGQFTNTVIVGTPTAASHATTKSYVDSAISSVTSTLGTAFTQNGNSFGALATLGTNDAYPLGLEVGGSTRITIATSGYVGVGTAPSYPLQVSGKIYSNTEIQGGSSVIKAGTTKAIFGSNSTVIPIFLNLNADDARSDLVVATSSYVGIGTAVPNAKLEVMSGTAADGDQVRINPASRSIEIVDRYSSLDYSAKISATWPGEGQLSFGVNASAGAPSTVVPTITIRNTSGVGTVGSVGIGNTAPSSTLHVSGTGQFTNTVVVGTPTIAGHAATKSYVDSSVGTIATSTFVKYADAIMNTNPFGGKQLFVNSINDAMFRAESRWVVTGNFYDASTDALVGTIPSGSLASLFDGNYETGLSIPAGQYAVVNVNFSTEPGGTYPGYPYGYFYLSHYYTQYSSSSTLSTVSTYSNYVPHGVGWHTYNFSTFYDNGSSALIKRARNDVYQISQAEFKIYAPSASAASITAIDWQLDRPFLNEMPLVDKYKTNYLYSGLGFKNSSAVTNAYINPTGISYFNGGNIGVGTSTPGYKLDVQGTGGFTGTLVVGTPTASSHATTKSYVDSAISSVTSTLGTAFLQNGNSFGGLATIGTNDAYPLGLEVGGSTKLTVATSGYVGIGTATPETRLHIWQNSNGDALTINRDSVASNNYINILFRHGTSANNAYDATISNYLYGDGKGSLDFSAGGAKVMTVRGSGYVGVGTTAPSSTLHVVGGIRGTGASQFDSTVVVGTPTASSHATTKSYVDTVAAGGTLWTATSTGLYLTSSTSNVGIGTTNPIYGRLQITDSGSYLDGFALYAGSGNLASSYLKSDGASDFNWHLTRGGSDTLGIVIKANGNVGLGTATPSAKFHTSVSVAGDTVGGIVGMPYTVSSTLYGSFGSSSKVGLVGSAQYGGSAALSGNPLGTQYASAGLVGIGAGTSGSAYGIGVAGFGQSVNVSTGLTAGGKFLANTNGSLNGGDSLYGVYSKADGTTNATSTGDLVYGIYANGTGAGNDTTYGGYFQGSGGTTNYGVYSAAGTNYFAGNTGIATAVPSSTLHVVGTGQFTSTVIVGTPTASTHATTKSYVDTVAAGGTLWTSTSTGAYLTNTSGSVGIGTASPGATLDVRGVISIPTQDVSVVSKYIKIGTYGTISETSNGLAYITGNAIRASQAVANQVVKTAGDAGQFMRMRYDTGISFHTNLTGIAGTEYSDTANTRMMIDLSGNVGIGNSSPSSTLHVTGGIRGTGASQFDSTVVVGTPTASGHAATKSYVDTVAAGGTLWSSTSTGLYATATSSYVGIGTAAPAYRLDVVGTGTAHGQSYVRFTNPTAYNLSVALNATGAGNANFGFTVNDVTKGAIGWNQADNSIFFWNAVADNTNVGMKLLSTGDTAFYNVSNGAANVTFLSSGSVGIGNSSPSSTLHVTGGIRGTGASQFDSTVVVGTPTAASHATTKSYVDSAISSVTSTLGTAFLQNGNSFAGTATLGTNNAYPLGLEVGGTTHLTIATSGYVGIGTTSPSVKLQVVGDVRFSSTQHGYSAHALVDMSTSTLWAKPAGYQGMIRASGSSGLPSNHNQSYFGYMVTSKRDMSDGYSAILTAYDNSRMWFTYNGDSASYPTWRELLWSGMSNSVGLMGSLGVGNTSPSSTLHVSGTGQFTGTVVVGTPTVASHAATKSYVDTAVGGGVGTGTTGQTLRHNGTGWIANSVIYNNGTNVGIGTTGPSNKLEVSQDVTAANFTGGVTQLHVTGATDNTKSLMFGFETENNYGFIQALDRGVSFSAYNLALMPKGGNVGIGTATPTAAKLTVAGTMQVDSGGGRMQVDSGGNVIIEL